MGLWQSKYGDRIYNLRYEKFITDQENQTKKLIDHLELNWEKACLAPHKNKRSVRTASQQQVRQKVYREALTLGENMNHILTVHLIAYFLRRLPSFSYNK